MRTWAISLLALALTGCGFFGGVKRSITRTELVVCPDVIPPIVSQCTEPETGPLTLTASGISRALNQERLERLACQRSLSAVLAAIDDCKQAVEGE